MSSKVFLPGLNGIRAIAASSVIIAHIAAHLVENGLFEKSYFGNFGGYAVTLFFTLSGFLITYLLLKEIEKKSDIDVKKFYIRRILRIWPLYFFYILLVLIVMNFAVSQNILYYIFIVPNIPFALQLATGSAVAIPLLIHYWSLGVEEQFYAFWPWLIKKSTHIKRTIIVFCVAFFGMKVVLSFLHAPVEWQALFQHTRFGCLAIGALGAYLYFEKNKLLSVLNSNYAALLSWIVLLLFFIDVLRVFSIVNNEIISVVTLVIIFNQINNPKPLISLENRVFDYLGKISFGLYIYNPLVIYLLSSQLTHLPVENLYLKTGVLFLITFLVIVLVSHISFFYLEKPFLAIKHKYTTVESSASNPKNIK